MLLHCLAGVEPALPEHETEHHEASYVWMYGGTGQDVGGKERVGVESILIFEVKLPEVVVVGGVASALEMVRVHELLNRSRRR